MKNVLLTSTVVLAALSVITPLHAEDAMPTEEKGILGSMADAVKTTAKDIKKATVGDAKPAETAAPEADEPDDDEDVVDEAKQQPSDTKASDENTDAADAEANRTVSDTSVTILSQNDYIKGIMQKTTHIQVKRLKLGISKSKAPLASTLSTLLIAASSCVAIFLFPPTATIAWLKIYPQITTWNSIFRQIQIV